VGKVRVTLARSLAGSLLPVEGIHSIISISIAGHLPLPIALLISLY
jgi:hypothetical protein